MIRMYVLPGSDVCHEVGVSHVNQRLIEMMEDVMEDYDPDWEKHGGAEHLRIDKGFADEIAYLFPPECSQEKGGFFFFLLYDLLKARDCYKPNLTMEYILFHLIIREEGLGKDMPNGYPPVRRIPEPYRTQMLKEIEDEIDEYDDIELDAEDLIVNYENVGCYREKCFEDWDCLILDSYSIDEIKEKGMAAYFGIDVEDDEYIRDEDDRKVKIRPGMFEDSRVSEP